MEAWNVNFLRGPSEWGYERGKKEVISQNFENVDDDEHDEIIFSLNLGLFMVLFSVLAAGLSMLKSIQNIYTKKKKKKKKERLVEETDREKEKK